MLVMSDGRTPGSQMRGAERFARGIVDDVRASLRAERLAEGYIEAANVCTGLIDMYIADLHKKAATGTLTKADQVLLAKFTDVKAEMETELQRYWDYLNR